MQFVDASIYAAFSHYTSPETKFGGRSSDAVQAYAREGAGHGRWRGLPSPGNLAERSFSDPSRCAGGVRKTSQTQTSKTSRPPGEESWKACKKVVWAVRRECDEASRTASPRPIDQGISKTSLFFAVAKGCQTFSLSTESVMKRTELSAIRMLTPPVW